jgi:hypothetical protein
MRYNGCTASEFDLQRTASYVDQVGWLSARLLLLAALLHEGPPEALQDVHGKA